MQNKLFMLTSLFIQSVNYSLDTNNLRFKVQKFAGCCDKYYPDQVVWSLCNLVEDLYRQVLYNQNCFDTVPTEEYIICSDCSIKPLFLHSDSVWIMKHGDNVSLVSKKEALAMLKYVKAN